MFVFFFFFFFQAEDGIRDTSVTGVQTCALPISGTEVWWSIFRPPRTALYPAFRGLFSHRPLYVVTAGEIGRASCRGRGVGGGGGGVVKKKEDEVGRTV